MHYNMILVSDHRMNFRTKELLLLLARCFPRGSRKWKEKKGREEMGEDFGIPVCHSPYETQRHNTAISGQYLV